MHALDADGWFLLVRADRCWRPTGCASAKAISSRLRPNRPSQSVRWEVERAGPRRIRASPPRRLTSRQLEGAHERAQTGHGQSGLPRQRTAFPGRKAHADTTTSARTCTISSHLRAISDMTCGRTFVGIWFGALGPSALEHSRPTAVAPASLTDTSYPLSTCQKSCT